MQLKNLVVSQIKYLESVVDFVVTSILKCQTSDTSLYCCVPV